MQVFIINKWILFQPWLVCYIQKKFRAKSGASWDVFSVFSFDFKYCGCYQGAMEAPYGTRTMGARGTKGLRKDCPEWNTPAVGGVSFPTSARFLTKWWCRIIASLPPPTPPHRKSKFQVWLTGDTIYFSFYISLNFISAAMRPVCNLLSKCL